ncbi:MAG: DUF1385 domain-containing protein [Firmicutes bacterium]|nr:DUF1385 domain-containing protein [Bacillota bacterium]
MLNIVEGKIRLLLSVFLIYLVSKLKDIKRILCTIEQNIKFFYKNNEELIFNNVRKYKNTQPICGTSFNSR